MKAALKGHLMAANSAADDQTIRYLCEELTKPLPIYSHAAIHGGVAHISAVQGFTPGTFTFPEGGVEAEAEQMMQNLGRILKGIGSGFDQILKMTLYFADMAKDFAATNDVVNRHIPDHSPARSSIGVAALPRNARVVIDCVVVAGGTAAVSPAPRASKETSMSAETYDIALINDLDSEAFERKLSRISSSKTWNLEMKQRRPFATADALLAAASDVWWDVCTRADWIESFNGRPIIGDQESFVKDKWCYLEDEHVIDTAKEVADELVRCNEPYMQKFGMVWILLCEGMTPEQQLANYKRRIDNDPRTELVENCVEEFKIIQRRLRLCLLNKDPYDSHA